MSENPQWPSSETIQFLRLPAKEESHSIVIAEPIIAQIISSQPNFPLSMEKPPEATYEIRATPNMGLGMFAKRALKLGDRILCERPALVYPNHFRSSNPTLSTSAEELEAAFCVALDQMRVHDRIAYRKLATGPDRFSKDGDLIRIARVNCFQFPPNPPGGPNERWTIGDYRAVYLDASRINHSCSPNTIAEFDFPSFLFLVRAVRDIQEGEEISTQYCALNALKLHRRQFLAFCMDSCGCSVCTNSVAADASEARRKAIASYSPWSIVNHLASSIDAPDKLLADILQCAQNIDDEGLQNILFYPMFLDMSGRLAAMDGNKELATTQREKAELFYQMRAWYTRDKNFVKWLFEPEESMSDRLRWAVSHFEDFQHMLNGW
ncbi:hypothetical protein FB451DRAFT_1088372 [Mycena latifolia]|nr:hypothetical protein FB451DRAFT_1088372 [Mycena latifolia]